MDYTVLNNNVKMPLLGFSVPDANESEREKEMLNALRLGYRSFDLTEGSVKFPVGDMLYRHGIGRKELFLAIRLAEPLSGYRDTKEGLQRVLEWLQLDFIDLLLLPESANDCGFAPSASPIFRPRNLANYAKRRKYRPPFIKSHGKALT